MSQSKFKLVRVSRSIPTTACGLAWLLLLVVSGCSGRQEIPPAAAHLVAAKVADENGDAETALRELEISIAAEPSVWAYAMRARLHSQAGDDEAARADCEAGLQLDGENAEIKWILEQLNKSPESRFQEPQPPSSK